MGLFLGFFAAEGGKFLIFGVLNPPNQVFWGIFAAKRRIFGVFFWGFSAAEGGKFLGVFSKTLKKTLDAPHVFRAEVSKLNAV